jgi:hypothetical protein
MATLLYAWELGGGVGHLANLLSLARGLCERGYRVVASLRDLSQVHRFSRSGDGVVRRRGQTWNVHFCPCSRQGAW